MNSLEVARELIGSSGLEESLSLFKTAGHGGTAPPEELLKWVLAMSACNLSRTLKLEHIQAQVQEEDRQDILDDYIVESLRRQDLQVFRDGAELMEKCQDILKAAEELESFWYGTPQDPGNPGPRYFCVKAVLEHLGAEDQLDLRDALFEFMYVQHSHFLAHFRRPRPQA
ncbi:MAG TPA: hypothetical protein VHE12_10140 [bacterium]|nr:hypothetical protein [bacterium]